MAMNRNGAQSEPGQSESADAARTPLDWPRHMGRVDRVMEAIEVRKLRQRRRRLRSALAGGSALFLAGAWLAWPTVDRELLPSMAAGVAVVALPERRTLPDGSVVELKTGAEIAVDFGGVFRRVVLRRGEAHFQVAKNPERQFVVNAGGMEFHAVGTAFAVQLSGTKVEMLVTEGRVAVEVMRLPGMSQTAERPGASPLAVVEAGNRVAVGLGEIGAGARLEVTPVTAVESGERLAWRVPRLELSDTPLAEAIAALNRHSPVVLEIGEDALGKLGISGVLRADNVEPLLRMLEENYDIRADRTGPDRIILRSRRP